MSEIYQASLLIASAISSIENRERKRSTDAQKKFEHAIECLLKDLWLGTVIHPKLAKLMVQNMVTSLGSFPLMSAQP